MKEISSTFDVHSRETTATILLARKREANILKMIALQLSCLQRLQKRNEKYNDEKQHSTLGSHSKAMASVTKCGCAIHMEPPEEEFMMILVTIVIALRRHNMKKGLYSIKRRLR